MVELKVTQIGNSQGVILPKDVLARLHVGKGEALFLLPHADGYVLTSLDPKIAQQLEMAADITDRYRNTLKKLAE